MSMDVCTRPTDDAMAVRFDSRDPEARFGPLERQGGRSSRREASVHAVP